MDKFISILILLTFGSITCFASPLSNPTNGNISTTTNATNLRQDGDGDVEEAVEGLNAVAGPIAQIITGTLSGNIGQLFNGITGTVTDQEAQPGVGQILSGVSVPLSTIWKGSIAAGQKYFNLTTPNPLGPQAVSTALPAAVAANGAVPLTPAQQLQGQQQVGVAGNQGVVPVVGAAPALPPAPIAVVEVTTPISEDDDEDEFENDLLNRKVVKA